jgi:Ring hydroxylating alpha subunit (catalytic domain)
MPEVLEYEAAIRAEVRERLGPRSRLINPIVGTMFPNFSLLRATSRTLRVWHPRGPDKTSVMPAKAGIQGNRRLSHPWIPARRFCGNDEEDAGR